MGMRLITLLLVLLAAAVAWAKPKYNPQPIIQRSDALYYFPQDHGLTDLAVDLTIDQFGAESVAGQAKATFAYAGNRRELLIDNVPEAHKAVRNTLYELLAPLGEYIIPKKSAENFDGLALAAVRVYRQLTGRPDSQYFLVYGTVTDAQAPLKEYRVLVDDRGLAHQVETEARNGGIVSARLENIQVGDAWVFGKISTRLATKAGPIWEVATVTYDTVEGFVLPTQVQTIHRNAFNQPVKDYPDLTIRLTDYRLNQGAGAALLSPVPPAAP